MQPKLLYRMERSLFDRVNDPDEKIKPDDLKLRPKATIFSDDESESGQDKSGPGMGMGMEENIIANVGIMENVFNSCIREHLVFNKECDGNVIVDKSRVVRMGLGIRAGFRCNICSYKTANKIKLYKEVHDDKCTKRGTKSVQLNVQLQVALTKEPIGNTSMRNILANLGIVPPSERGMQTCSNAVSNLFQQLSAEQLQENRKFVNKVMSIRGEYNEDLSAAKIAVVADAAYNNPVKGRAFTQPGTQSWLPMLCAEKNMEDIPVAFSTRSKLCSCPLKYKGVHATEK